MLKLYNTLTRKKETFKPVEKEKVRMYVCGPTVNDVPHLGHARQQIVFDILRRYLKFLGYKVEFVSNITDIEDKIINKARELSICIEELSKRNEKEHMKDYALLGVEKPDVQPKATEYIPEMIELIKKLEKKKYTYILNDGVYFDVSKFKEYGKLSNQKIENLKAGKRVAVKSEKKNKEDFVLWKFSKQNEPAWDSPWGLGRPGWHIECSAMSEKILGLPIDIHGGGQDLIFPHHEDEIAQSEAGYGKKFVDYWVHNGLVNVSGEKMSKSLGNFTTIRDLLKKYKPEIIRYFVLSTQYRKPEDFTFQALDSARDSYDRLRNIISSEKDDRKINKNFIKKFQQAMDDDLNTPKALAVLWELGRGRNEGKIQTIKQIDEVFGLNLLKKEKILIPADVRKLAEERLNARQNKDWGKADRLRKEIKKKGYVIEDKGEGFELKKG